MEIWKFTSHRIYSLKACVAGSSSDFTMKMTCALLFLCCCIFFLSTPAKGELGRTQRGALGVKRKGDDLPFCPIDKKRSKQIQEITAIFKESAASQDKLRETDSRRGPRPVRSTSSCNFPFPHCVVASLRVDAKGESTMHGPMIDCCSDCRDVTFAKCLSDKKPCLDCIHKWTECMNKCTVLHFCTLLEGTKILPGSKGGTLAVHKKKGDKGTMQPNLCPTSKVKYGGSYCIKRSCYPIRV